MGFVTRPLGAAVIGAYADREGRRAALTLTLLLMAFGSAIVAVTPPYATIGSAAPIILLVARLIQGFSCGGEVGPATTYLLESAPIEKRAAVTAWQGYSQQLAIFLGSLVGVILASYPVAGATVCVGLARAVPARRGHCARSRCTSAASCRKRSSELRHHRSTRACSATLLREHWRPVAIGILIICGGTISTYVFNYMTTYAITTLHLSAAIGTTLTLTGSVAQNRRDLHRRLGWIASAAKRMLIACSARSS